MGVPALLWAELTAEQVERLEAAATREEVRGVLAELCTSEAKHPQRREVCTSAERLPVTSFWCDRPRPLSQILLELYFNLLHFSRQRRFGTEKTSVLFALFKQTHEEMVSSKWMRPGPTGRLADRYYPPLGGSLSDSAADLGILQGAAARACGAAAAILGLPPSPLERIDHIPL